MKKRKTYKVINGCNTADGKRYEIGDAYDPKDHDKKTTETLLRLKCIENGDS